MRGLRRGNIMSVYDDEILQQYEQKQKWGKCISYLTSLVDETNFLDVNIRIFIECWYVLSNWDCFIAVENNHMYIFSQNLKKAYDVILNAKNNTLGKTIMGYCISSTPLVFDFLEGDYCMIEKYGNKLIREEKKNNCFAMFLNEFEKKEVIEENLLKQCKKIFIGNSESVNYFFELINDYKRCY